MCVFVGDVEEVSGTRIFAAPGADGMQKLVYAMDLATAQDVAMILPLPVAPDGGKDAVRFIDLSDYPEFFDGLSELFGAPAFAGAEADELSLGTLEVQRVGDFEASHVPSHDDWDRLDARFRLDPTVWEQLPQYHDYGFAVFQLAPAARGRTTAQSLHPMAFEFASRNPHDLFFPTVHIHDGRVHANAEFDHTLYCQVPDDHPLLAELTAFDPAADAVQLIDPTRWHPSWLEAHHTMDVGRAAGLLRPEAQVLRHEIRGSHPNRDIVLERDV